jgi:hypothetical protein
MHVNAQYIRVFERVRVCVVYVCDLCIFTHVVMRACTHAQYASVFELFGACIVFVCDLCICVHVFMHACVLHSFMRIRVLVGFL